MNIHNTLQLYRMFGVINFKFKTYVLCPICMHIVKGKLMAFCFCSKLKLFQALFYLSILK